MVVVSDTDEQKQHQESWLKPSKCAVRDVVQGASFAAVLASLEVQYRCSGSKEKKSKDKEMDKQKADDQHQDQDEEKDRQATATATANGQGQAVGPSADE